MTDVNEAQNQPAPIPPDDIDDSLWATIERNRSAITILGAVGLFAITLLAYSPAMRGEFIWDDDYYVTANPQLRTGQGLQDIWFKPGATVQYYPMVFTSFWIEYRLWGLNPLGYHIVNVLLHATAATFLWVLLRRLKIPGAWAAAAIWALHPIQVESVAWITERKNVLSGVFYFATMLVYLRYCGLIEPPQRKKEWLALPDDPTRVYALVILLFACALLSKSVTFSLPAAVLLLIWWKRGRIVWYEKDPSNPSGFRSDVVPLLPLLAMGIGMGLMTAYVERTVVGAFGRISTSPRRWWGSSRTAR